MPGLNSFTPQMTPRERMIASFTGGPVDCFPVTVPYLFLLHADLWTRVTHLPAWEYYRWMLQEPDNHIQGYQRILNILTFDIAQPEISRTREERKRLRIVPGDGETLGDPDSWYELDSQSGNRKKLILNLHEKDQAHEWLRTVYSQGDILEQIPISPTRELFSSGIYDYLKAYVDAFGQEQFVVGTIVNAFYASSWYVGLLERFLLLRDEPGLMHAIIDRLIQRTVEEIRGFAKAGCDAIYIDDATATKDMISKDMYLEFSQPYLIRLVEEIHNQGMRAILVYFGGIEDRVDEIVDVGADGLLMETSMKGYVNNLESIAAQVNNQMLMFGNLDPVADLEQASDETLIERMAAQIAVGKKYGRFVVSTGSPITPDTSLKRVQDLITWAHNLSVF